MQDTYTKQKLFVSGDINGFLCLAIDNVAMVAVFTGILLGGFHFPQEIIFKFMLPGIALTVFLGDIIMTIVGWQLAKKTKTQITAMPLGIDAPTVIAVALLVIGPIFLRFKGLGYSEYDAGLVAWQVGMAGAVIIGLVKVALSFFGEKIRQVIPRAGLLGALAGIGLGFLCYLPFVTVFKMPLVGIIAFCFILIVFVGKINISKFLPGVMISIVVGACLYHILGYYGIGIEGYHAPEFSLALTAPKPSLEFIKGLSLAVEMLPIYLPLAIIVLVGGINVVESAHAEGDTYNTGTILFIDGVVTIIGGLFGGVVQTTLFIGQPAYKRMGARLGYTLLTAIFIGLGGFLGYLSLFVSLIPEAALAPILIFVGFEIINQSFICCDKKYFSAVIISIIPTLARVITIQVTNPELVSPEKLQKLLYLSEGGFSVIWATITLGNGFILVGMLWGAAVAEIINQRLLRSFIYFIIMSAFSLFGIINSVTVNGEVYLPWTLTSIQSEYAYMISISYFVCAIILVFVNMIKGEEI